MIVNLTPHPMHIYAAGTPDRVEPAAMTPILVIEPSADHEPARLGQKVITQTGMQQGIAVDLVAFGPEEEAEPLLPRARRGTSYLVSLVVGLAATSRTDLLVPHSYVRDMGGRIIGCRRLAAPQRPQQRETQRERLLALVREFGIKPFSLARTAPGVYLAAGSGGVSGGAGLLAAFEFDRAGAFVELEMFDAGA